MKLEDKINIVNESYFRRQKKEEKVWEGFDKEVKELTKIVEGAFRSVLKKIGPLKHSSIYADSEAVIKEFVVDYHPQFKEFGIKITKLETPEGILDDDDVSTHNICPHGYLDLLHPRIKRFREMYFVGNIEYPNNNCEHK